MISKVIFREIHKEEQSSIIDSLYEFGYAKIKSYFNFDDALRIGDWLTSKHSDLITKGRSYKERARASSKDKIIFSIHKYNDVFLDFIDTSIVRKILIKFLNDPYYRLIHDELPNFTLGYFNARSSGKELPLHIDNYIPYSGSKPLACQVAYYFNKSDIKNGCTIVVPKSHKSGTYADRSTTDIMPIICQPGDCVVWDSRIWHGTNNNIESNDRWALIATYKQWFLKQTLEMTSTISSSQYSNLNNVQKQLLGFCSMTPKNEFNNVVTKKGYEDLPTTINQ